MDTVGQITDTLKTYILETFLPEENPEALTDSTPLITGGVLDSLATLKLVGFIEERFNIELQAHEVDVQHLNTIAGIAGLVQGKLR